MLTTLEPDTVHTELSALSETDITAFLSRLGAADPALTGASATVASWRDGSEFRDWSKG